MSLEDLYKRRTFGIKLGLDVERDLLARMGNPEREMGIIHVAGTNGKGSVCAMLESILVSAGVDTGLYTSPHLVRFNERIRVNGAFVSDDELEDLVSEIEKVSGETAESTGQEATFFECATAMALAYFKRKGVKIAILEAGMGGRLDATNVVEPLVSVITRIDVEHSEHLGPDIETIAGEKCGIIKKGRPVVCGAMCEEARGVVRRLAKERTAPFIDAEENASVVVKSSDMDGQKVVVETGSVSYGTLALSLAGRHQAENLSTAVTVVDVLNDMIGLDISWKDVVRGISSVNWPGRCQLIRREPPVILDGAHNPGASRVLAETLKEIGENRPIALILGMCADKNVKNFLHPFAGLVKTVWITGIKSDRNMPFDHIVSAASSIGAKVFEAELGQAMEDAVSWAIEQGGMVCITGSLFLVGEVLGLGLSRGPELEDSQRPRNSPQPSLSYEQ